MLLLFALTLFANFASTTPMSFRLTSSEVLPPGVFLRISPFLQKGGVLLEGLGMPEFRLPEVFPLLPLDFFLAGGGGGASGGSFGARKLASVSSVHL